MENWQDAKREVESIQIEDMREYETQGGLG
jgi:hypothetical protein